MDLSPWGSPPLGERLGGGHRNVVYRAGDWVARRSRRSPASLEWELDLLDHLSRNDFIVPAVVPTRDGRRHVDGVVVQAWLPGREPTGDDWPHVADELRRLHVLMAGWPPRPDFPGTRELLTRDQGGDVDLTRMPASVVARCRKAWQALTGPTTVVHGDPCAANIRVQDDDRIGFLDWDEARVDHPWLDLADLPGHQFQATTVATTRATTVATTTPMPAAVSATMPAAVSAAVSAARASAAVNAWEAANAWFMEPRYARRRLARVPVDHFVDN
jgi:Ser/Thr protein kinase RdoA (MazF antagonist)